MHFACDIDESGGVNLGPCLLCGEACTIKDEVGEMHSPEILEYDYPEEIQRKLSGLVHAQCGLSAGWRIS